MYYKNITTVALSGLFPIVFTQHEKIHGDIKVDKSLL